MDILSRSAHTQVIDQDDILALIICFVGVGEWLYIASVSKRFHQFYANLNQKRKCPRTGTFIANAFISGSRMLLASQAGLKLNGNQRMCIVAGEFGTEKSLELAKEIGLPWTKDLCSAAANAGRFQLVLWLHIDKCCPWDASIVRLAAARHGQEEICIWLWRQADVRWRRNDMMCQTAAEYGQTEILKWMHSNDCLWEEGRGICVAASAGGHVGVLRWLYQQGFALDGVRCATVALLNGHAQILPELQEMVGMAGWFCNSVTTHAVTAGCSDALQYIHDLGLGIWTVQEMTHLLSGGIKTGGKTVPALKWLRSHGANIPIDGATLAALAVLSNGDWEIVEWGLSEGLPWGDWPIDMITSLLSFSKGHKTIAMAIEAGVLLPPNNS